MALELGDVIAHIGGDGGGGPVPHRYVHDFGPTPIPVTTSGDVLMHEVPDVPEGATLVVTLHWAGPETGGTGMMLAHVVDEAVAFGLATEYDFGYEARFPPVTVVATASGEEEERGMFFFVAVAEGYTATKLEAIIIPAIK